MVRVPEFHRLPHRFLLVAAVTALPACSGPKLDSADAGACPSFGAPEAVNRIETPLLTEASGLASSLLHDAVLWTHNDDGEEDGYLFALSTLGELRSTLTLPGVRPTDWESVSLTDARGQPELVVGDIGDNDGARESVSLLLVAEPDTLDANVSAPIVERVAFSFPDGPVDVEATMVDPATGTILVLTRASDRSDVYSIDLTSPDPEPLLEGTIPLNDTALAPLGAVRAAEVAADGSVVLRLSDGAAWFAARESAIESLGGTPCVFAAPPEEDGEGVAVLGDSLYFIGEGDGPTLWRVSRSGP